MISKSKFFSRKLKAFTLVELLLVLVIMGILILLALPNLMPLISKAKSTEAQLQLEHLQMLEKSYFYMYSKYSPDFKEIGFEHSKMVAEEGTANYRIEIIEASATTFKGRATAVTDFDGDGIFNVWEIDQEKKIKEITPD